MAKVPDYEIDAEVTYLCHPDHRNGTQHKSQWRITEPEEVDSFKHTWNEGWIVGQYGWGLHLINGEVNYLGVAQDHRTRLFIAKFVNDTNHGQWHGYPADHQSITDRPDDQIIAMWLANNTLPAAKLRKVQKGEPCNL